jgi:hypothetical protein
MALNKNKATCTLIISNMMAGSKLSIYDKLENRYISQVCPTGKRTIDIPKATPVDVTVTHVNAATYRQQITLNSNVESLVVAQGRIATTINYQPITWTTFPSTSSTADFVYSWPTYGNTWTIR